MNGGVCFIYSHSPVLYPCSLMPGVRLPKAPRVPCETLSIQAMNQVLDHVCMYYTQICSPPPKIPCTTITSTPICVSTHPSGIHTMTNLKNPTLLKTAYLEFPITKSNDLSEGYASEYIHIHMCLSGLYPLSFTSRNFQIKFNRHPGGESLIRDSRTCQKQKNRTASFRSSLNWLPPSTAKDICGTIPPPGDWEIKTHCRTRGWTYKILGARKNTYIKHTHASQRATTVINPTKRIPSHMIPPR